MVAISYEMIHDTRVFYTDGRPHLSPSIRQYLGDARGHWEGNTLVIETTNFTDQTSIGGNGNGLRHSDALKLTERVTRVDAQTMEYVVTVDDPKTYVKPFTMLLVCGCVRDGTRMSGPLAVSRRLVAVFAADVEGYSRLMAGRPKG